jgi:O-antigen/teichoic acid export membrane protein
MNALVGLRIKLTLLVLFFLAAFTVGQGPAAWLLLALTAAQIADGAQEFLFSMMRARGHYALEPRFVSVAALLHCGFVILVALDSRSVLLVAAAFCASRLVQLLAAAMLLQSQLQLRPAASCWRDQWQAARAGWAYTMDVGLATLNAQFDTILVRLLLGSTAAGLYQAGMRVVAGMQSFVVVAGNVFIPRLAGALREPAAWRACARQADRGFWALAAAGGLAVGVLGSLLTHFGYGAAYAPLQAVWPWLALLFALRVLAARYGVALTALGAQAFRSSVNLLSLALSVLALLLLLQWWPHLLSVIGVLLGSAVFILLVYRHRANQLEPRP